MGAVRIRLAGSFAVLGNTSTDGPGAPVPLGSRKARQLLARLAAANGAVVGMAEIVDVLWPQAAPHRPEDNVATLISRLRAVLGRDAILGDRHGYRIGGPSAVWVDLTEIAALTAEAERRLRGDEPALAASTATRGLELLGDGSVLVGEPDAAWLDVLRNTIELTLRSLRHTLAEATTATGETATAVSAAQSAVEADPLDEQAFRLLMNAHDAAGEPARALAAFERLRAALADQLGIDPAARTQALHAAILREEHGSPPARQRWPAPRTTLVGRDSELAELAAAWSAAASGTGSTLLVTGEAGIGKTALAEAVATLAETTGGVALRARCYAAENSLFLQPVLDALGPALLRRPATEARRLAGQGREVLAALLPDTVAILGEPELSADSPELARRRAFDAIRGTLQGLGATTPVLLLLDDLHNAGVATIELLHYLSRRCAATRLLVLATVRSEEGATALDRLVEVAHRVDVGPLGADAVALLASRAGVPRQAEDILLRTRGHTLFVVESLRALAAGERGVPETLRAAVLARLRHVGEDVERVLRAGAVLGAAAAPDLVAAMLELPTPEVVLRCEHAAAARLLVPTAAEYEFANDLVREVLYATTSAPTRLAHHRRAADLLTDRPEVLAGHAEALGDWPRAAYAWLAAGEMAVERFAFADARVLLNRALEVVDGPRHPTLTGRIHLARAGALEALAAFDSAGEDLRAAVTAFRGAGDRKLELTAVRAYLSEIASVIPLTELERQLAAGARIARELADPVAQADLGGARTVLAANRLRLVEAVEFGTRAVAAGRCGDDEDALAASLDGLKTAYAHLGATRELTEVLVELEPLLRRRGRLHLLSWAVFDSALLAVATADWDTAAARIDDALRINRRGGMRATESWLLAHRGWVERLRGRHGDAVELGRHAVEFARSAPHTWWQPTANALLATTLLELGEDVEATELLVEAGEVAERGEVEAYRLRAIAQLAEVTGSPELLAAAEALLGGITAPTGAAWLAGGETYLAVARGRLDHDEPDRARELIAPLLTATQNNNGIPLRAAGSLVDGMALAALGRRERAIQQFHRARALAERHGMLHLAAQAAKRLG